MTKGGQRVRSDIMEKYVNAGECTVFASAISPLSVVPLLQLDFFCFFFFFSFSVILPSRFLSSGI